MIYIRHEEVSGTTVMFFYSIHMKRELKIFSSSCFLNLISDFFRIGTLLTLLLLSVHREMVKFAISGYNRDPRWKGWHQWKNRTKNCKIVTYFEKYKLSILADAQLIRKMSDSVTREFGIKLCKQTWLRVPAHHHTTCGAPFALFLDRRQKLWNAHLTYRCQLC